MQSTFLFDPVLVQLVSSLFPTLVTRSILSPPLLLLSTTMSASPEKPLDSRDNAQYLEVASKQDSGDGQTSPLPSPVSTPAPKTKPKFQSTTIIIPIWICLSSAVIIYNNYLYNTLNFKYPVFLVTWHLSFAVSLLFDIIIWVVRWPSVY